MKSILTLALLLSSPVVSVAATYRCSTSAFLDVVETKWAEPRVDFYPNGSSSTTAGGAQVFSAYISELQHSALASDQQLTITRNTHLGVVKVYNTVSFDSALLQGAGEINVVKSQKVVSTLGQKVLSTDSRNYRCVLQ